VFEGQATVQDAGRQVKVKGGREVNLNSTGKLKAHKFDKKSYEGDLYRFSSLRSDYLAEANAQAARVYVTYGWWPSVGWWWNPWFGGYTFIPATGVFYSPFGWGFYSPFALRLGPYYIGPYHPYRPHPWGPPLASGHPHGSQLGDHPMIGGFPRGPMLGAFHGPGGFEGGAVHR
jgi:hypothetical protein